MPSPTSPWLHSSPRPLPRIPDRKELEAHLNKLLGDENRASLERLLQADPRLIAFVVELTRKGGES